MPCALVLAAFAMMARSHVEWYTGIEWVVGVYVLIVVAIHWRRIGKYFSSLTHYAETNKMRKELRIIELFCFTLAMAHLFVTVPSFRLY